jgi:tetratricopeptide (TPR) repeat protein
MKRIKILMLSVAVLGASVVALFGIRAATQGSARPRATQPTSVAPNSLPATPGDQRVIAAQAMIERLPSDARGYNLLAAAYMQKARETGDFGFNAKADEALARSEKSEPDNYDALKLRAKLLLTFHRFAEALEASQRAQQVNPRDHDVYGAMTDALVELGDYPKAVEAAQMMMDLRPDTASYSRVSYLRQLHGDTKGAIEAMRIAAQAANPQDPESLSWCLVQLGDALMNAGQPADAEREYDRALYSFPDYHLALAAKARARLAAGDTGKAIEFYRRATERVPLPDYAIALGDLYTKLGQTEEAKRQYALVEFVERAGSNNNTYSRQLALFWADHDMRLDDALAAAERERAARGDIYTCDALAWCLYKKGRLAEAKSAMDEALRLGTRDARLLYHAGMIGNALGDRQAAAKSLKAALAINAALDVLQADVARRTLAGIKA